MFSRRLVLVSALAASFACSGSEPFRSSFVPDPTAGAFLGMFEGKFPCEGCAKVKTAVSLYEDPITKEPSNYRLRQIFVQRDDNKYDSKGTWKLSRGTKNDPDAAVIELIPDDGSAPMLYLRLDDNLLLLLDDERALRVGDAANNFTLSRTR